MTSPVVLELKPEEVEFLISLRRCALCDHLGALHPLTREAKMKYRHCQWCEDHNGDCDGEDFEPDPIECLLCNCTGYK